MNRTIRVLAAGVSLVASIGLVGVPAVTAAGPATGLAFQAQPGGGAPGAAWGQQPVVRVVDASTQTVPASTAAVTLAIGSKPGGGTLTCAGGRTVAGGHGVRPFRGLESHSRG